MQSWLCWVDALPLRATGATVVGILLYFIFLLYLFLLCLWGVHLPQYTHRGQRSALVRVIRACTASWLFLSDGVQILNSGHRGW